VSRFDRFRAEVGRYAEGVHLLEPPAATEAVAAAERALGLPLPEAYRSFLLQCSNGAFLFHDDYTLFGVGPERDGPQRVQRHGELVWFGVGEGPLCFDERGRVLRLDGGEEEPQPRVEGSGFERWLDAVMAREALLYDREGEFRDAVFDEEQELAPRLRRRRAQAGIAADPVAPAWREELAAILVGEKKLGRAATELERAVALQPELPSAWFALGKLRREAGEPDAAALAFRRAAEAEGDPEEAAFAFAHAAQRRGGGGAPRRAGARRRGGGADAELRGPAARGGGAPARRQPARRGARAHHAGAGGRARRRGAAAARRARACTRIAARPRVTTSRRAAARR
jgi:hypothetical protein